MNENRVEKVLRLVAVEYLGRDSMGRTNLLELLEERLGPLLRAGQAMRNHAPKELPSLPCAKPIFNFFEAEASWDAALAALER